MKIIKLNLKRRTLLFLILVILITFFHASCNKQETSIDKTANNTLAAKVIGTYSGTLKNSTTYNSTQATLTTTSLNDSLVSIHCIAFGFDTTISVQLYQNYDSIMFCFIGQDFYNAYGHNRNNYDFCHSKQSGWMNNNWMNDGNWMGNMMHNWGNNSWAGNDQWNAWTNHMNTQHNKNDMHFGGFNHILKSCNYRFYMHSGNTHYFEIFNGVKN